jgi:hypothetical protein
LVSGRRLAAFLAAALAATPELAAAAAPQVQVKATLEPEVIRLDETATFTIEAQGGGFGSLRFEPRFTLDNLEIAGEPSQFENFKLINGALSRSYGLTWQLRPLAPGPARVRSIAIRLAGKVAALAAHEILVQEQPAGGGAAAGRGSTLPRATPQDDPLDLFGQLLGGGSPPEAPRQEPAAFLRAEIEPPRPVAGQQVLYTLYLYTRQDVAAINTRSLPTFRGFWVRDLPQPEHPTPEMLSVGGARYARVPLARKALFALRPGRHPLEAAAMDVVLESVEHGFFGSALARPEQLYLRTPETVVEVLPLPAAPPGFAGAVGQLVLTSAVQPGTVRLGEGATFTVTLSGTGNLQGVPPPQLTAQPGLAIYPPQQQSVDGVTGTEVAGKHTWTFVVIPRRPGLYPLHPAAITYFDPAIREYRLAAAPPVTFTALGVPARPGADGAAGAAEMRGAAAPGVRGRDGARAARWPLLLTGLILAAGLVLAAVLVRRRALPGTRPAPAAGSQSAADSQAAAGSCQAPADDQGTGAARGAGSVSRRDLERRLRALAAETRPRQAAAGIEDAWRGFLAARWAIAAETLPARWGDLLAARGVERGTAGEVGRLSQDLHYLRYAPQLSATDTLRDELLSRSRSLLRRLR